RSLAGGNGQLSESSWSGAPGIPDAPLQLFGRRGGCPALGRAGRFRSPKAGGELSCQPRTGRSRQPAPRVGTGGEKSAGAAKPPPHRRCTLLASYSLSCSGRVVDRKSTRLNSSHVKISYAVFCLKKKTQYIPSA